MDVNTINSSLVYEKSTASRTEETLVATDSSISYSKTTETATSEKAAVIYEKGTEAIEKKPKSDMATIERMKAEADQKNAQLKSLVEKMILKQGKQVTKSTDIWEMLRTGKLEVDPKTAAQAKADIAEDGYWGVEQTSDRLVSFAKALAGNDPEYADKLIDAMKEGFKQATGDWGDKLPDICSKTIDAAVSKMEAWRDGKETAAAADTATK